MLHFGKTIRVGLFGLVSLLIACGSTTDQLLSKGDEMSGDPTTAPSITDGVQLRKLDNGLTVLVREVHAAPVVAAMTWVKTGYFHEPDEVAGISHVVEHMYFNGTPTRPDPEDISRETKSYGGVLNAGTAYDHTSYHVVTPSARWREALAVQADAFQNPLFDAKVLEKEMGAILQEARRKLDEPVAFAREKMFEAAFERHRMRRWRIGTEDVLTALTRDDLVRWYEDHYRPGNTVIAIVGDVAAEDVFAEVEKLYGGHERGHLRQRTGPSEPRQKEFRYTRLAGELSRGYVVAGFHTPGNNHEDEAALDVLATILGAGRSSRFGHRLKDELGIVSAVSASNYSYDDVGMFEILAVCDAREIELTTQELFVEIERLRHFGPTPEEMQRARQILITGEAYGFEEVLGQAATLAAYEARGSYTDYDEDLRRLRAVGVDDVMRVLNEYLNLDQATLLEYAPYMTRPARDAEAMRLHLEGAQVAAAKTMKSPAELPIAQSYLPREELASWTAKFSAPDRSSESRKRFDLPQGATLIVEENHTAPTVSVGAYFRGGRLQEVPKTAGLTHIMQRSMVKATDSRDAIQMAREIEGLGTMIGRVNNYDWFGFTIGGLASNFAPAFDILFDAIARPRFLNEDVQVEIKQQMVAAQGAEDRSALQAIDLVRQGLYGDLPYGKPNLGVPRVMRFFRDDQMGEHHYKTVRPESLVLVVSGDVDADAVREFVSIYVDGWRVGGAPEPGNGTEYFESSRFEALPALTQPVLAKTSKERTQTAMVMAYPTVPRTHEDRPAFDVLQSLTGGLGGTFFERIRTERGLAYQVSTFSSGNMLAGYWGTFVACSPDSADVVRDLVVALHNELAQTAPDDESIERSKNAIIGSYEIGRQTNGARASTLAALELSGRALERADDYPDRVRAVSAEDLTRIARDYFLGKPAALGLVEGQKGLDANPR